MTDGLLALLALSMCWQNSRMVGLCLVYAATRLSFDYLAPPPTDWWWYFLCAFGELVVIIGAISVSAPASRLLAISSGTAIAIHLAAAAEYNTSSMVVYTAYPFLIQFIELVQVLGLFAFSPPLLNTIQWMWHFKTPKGGDGSWMLNSLKESSSR
jgi:hypothetical protein